MGNQRDEYIASNRSPFKGKKQSFNLRVKKEIWIKLKQD